jgi:hypothetical protein
MQTTMLEAMDREAEAFRERLNALRPGASVTHAGIIDKLSAVVETSHAIVRDALEHVKRRTPTTDVSR